MIRDHSLTSPLTDRREATTTLVHMLSEACQSAYASKKRWHIETSETAAIQWLHCYVEATTLPQQGWKLHISAHSATAKDVLARVLPVLLAEATAFKVIASLDMLQLLNQGWGGISQIGKFITVYPENDAAAVHLAALLDAATRGLPGPAIPSDRALHSGSLVHYRYGGIASHLCVQTPTGAILPALRTPENTLVPDYRSLRYRVPWSLPDPFLAASVARDLPTASRMLGGRYLILMMISASINHSIYLAADLNGARSCVVKGPGYIYQGRVPDQAALACLRNEAEALARLAGDPHVPTLYDMVEQHHHLYLIMEDLDAQTLSDYMKRMGEEGRSLPLPQTLAWAQQIAEILDGVHRQGFVHGDVKPSNILLGTNGRLYLIDFGLAQKLGAQKSPLSNRGTRGYKPLEQPTSQQVTIDDDVYGFGALLYFLLTGANPSSAPQPHHLLSRPLALLRPGLQGSLQQVVARCLHEQPEKRYSSLADLQLALQAASADTCQPPVPFGRAPVNGEAARSRARYHTLAGRLLETLCAMARPTASPRGVIWMSSHPLASGCVSGNICTGNGGIVLALAELAAEFQDARAYAILAQGAHWLRDAAPVSNQPLPGLYVGEAGRGAALLRAGQVLRDRQLIASASEQGKRITALPDTSPDLYGGIAGCLRFYLFLWDETGLPDHLQAARACGERLLHTCIRGHAGEAWWTMPEHYGSLSRQAPPGYAHGAAGIADALLDLFEVTRDEQLLPVIEGVGRWLTRQAVASLDDGSGLNWPKIEGGALAPPFWCHGATGIGRFFLHAAGCNLVPGAIKLAARAARTAARGARWAGPTQCHGLAGNIEFLLDMYQATGDERYLREAFSLGSLLEAFATERDGLLVFPSDIPDIFTPDYLIGYSGVALCLLRLSAPERLPHQLSRAGFRTEKGDGNSSH